MKEKFQFTKDQLTNAFKLWDDDYEKNPQDYEEVLTPSLQADALLYYLKQACK